MNRKVFAALLSVVSNTLLVGLKVMVGLWTGSLSVLSEAIHTGIDLIASLMAFFSVRHAQVPADENHPYGHGKLEDLSGFVEALLIIVAAGWIVWEAGHRLFGGGPHHLEHLGWGLGIMALSVVINGLVSRYLLRVAKETDSVALLADGHHLSADVYSSLAILGGLFLVQITGQAWLDPVIALGVAIWIGWIGVQVSRQAVAGLLDETVPEDEAKVRTVLDLHRDHYVEYHDLRVRRAGSQRHVDLHLIFSGEARLDDVHDVCDQLEEAIHAVWPGTVVVIHPEPLHERKRTLRPH